MPEDKNTFFLGVDTGGTFTDFVLFENGELRVHKVLSTPDAPERAILQGIEELGLMDRLAELNVVHGSTVATNAALEGKGVRTAFITNHGLKDLLTIGRQNRQELYNLQPRKIAPPVAEELCLEVGGRLGADGSLVEPLSDEELEALRHQLEALQPQAVAINLLFSFLDETFEKRVAEAMPEGVFVSRSSQVLPEIKEYERGIATWLNAWVGPLVQDYLGRLRAGLPGASVAVMQSSGDTIDVAQAGRFAVNMLLSGPAGGLAGAQAVAKEAGRERLLTFDMGGTSTDVALIDGGLQLTSEGRIGPWPVAVPQVDMHTIGAGGGSIAYVDSGGLLQVGPESAGALPGPACYGRGGERPTVTDANLVLGRLRPDAFLGGGMGLDLEAARKAVATVAGPLGLSVEACAVGIIRIANEHMARALRVMSVQRGIDPRRLILVSFGGAGGLHVCALAEALGMPEALVPIHGGVLSAMGMLAAPRGRQLSRTVQGLLGDFSVAELEARLTELERHGAAALAAEGVSGDALRRSPSLDLRYQGQSYTLNVPWEGERDEAEAAFHAAHEGRYGHRLERPVELVNVRLGLEGPQPAVSLAATSGERAAEPFSQAALYGIEDGVPVYRREELAVGQVLQGPALITEKVSTSLIAEGWRCERLAAGSLLLSRTIL